jgi:hypothetical protein
MRAFFIIGIVGCLLATSMAVMAAAINHNSPAVDNLNFLNHYDARNAKPIENTKQFLQADSYIAKKGPDYADEDLIAYAQTNYAVVHTAPSVPSLSQSGILREWLETHLAGPTEKVKALIYASADIKNVLEKDTMKEAITALQDVYKNIKLVYDENVIPLWLFDQFTAFTFKTESE